MTKSLLIPPQQQAQTYSAQQRQKQALLYLIKAMSPERTSAYLQPEAFWPSNAERYFADDPDFEKNCLEPLVKALPAGARVLDLACGVGVETRELEERGFEVYPLDANPEFLKLVKHKFPDQLTSPTLRMLFALNSDRFPFIREILDKYARLESADRKIVADAAHLPFAAETLDAVLIKHLLTFGADQERLDILKETYSALKPGGKIALYLEDRKDLIDFLPDNSGKSVPTKIDDPTTHIPTQQAIYPMTLEIATQLLERAGFKIIEAKTAPSYTDRWQGEPAQISILAEKQSLPTRESTPIRPEQIWSQLAEYQPDLKLLQEVSRLETQIAQNPVFRCPNPEDLAQNPHALQKVSQRAGLTLPEDIPVTELIQEGVRLVFTTEEAPTSPTIEIAKKLMGTYYDYETEFNQSLADIETAIANTEAREFQLRTLKAIFEQTITVFQPKLDKADQEKLLEEMLSCVRFDAHYRFPYGGIGQSLGGTYPNGQVAHAVFGQKNYNTINLPSTLFLKKEANDQLQGDYITVFHESVHLLKALGLEIDDSIAPTTYGLLTASATGFNSMRIIQEVKHLEQTVQELQSQGVTDPAEIKKRLAELDPGEKYLLGTYYYQQLKSEPSPLQRATLRQLAKEAR